MGKSENLKIKGKKKLFLTSKTFDWDTWYSNSSLFLQMQFGLFPVPKWFAMKYNSVQNQRKFIGSLYVFMYWLYLGNSMYEGKSGNKRIVTRGRRDRINKSVQWRGNWRSGVRLHIQVIWKWNPFMKSHLVPYL